VLGAAAFPAAEERKIRVLKEAGFNSVRIAHNPPSLALLEACDRLGMIVQDEAFDIWNKRKLAVTADYHIFFKEWWDRDISYMVKRDRNHPCVMSYSIGNEIYEIDGTSGAAEWSRKLSDEIRKYDNTKLVTSAIQKITLADYRPEDIDPESYQKYMREKTGGKDQRKINKITEGFEAPLDIVGFNYHHDHYGVFHEDNPDTVIWGSENWTIDIYKDWQDVVNNNYVIGDFTWTAIDNLGEVGHGQGFWERDRVAITEKGIKFPWRTCYQGDLDLCGFRRPQSHFREAVWFGGDTPKMFVTHPENYGEEYYGTGWHWFDVHDSWTFDDKYIGRPIKVDTYIQADKVEWLVNGKKVGEAVPEKALATLHTTYEKGEITAIAYKGGKEFSRYTIKTIDKAAGVNVKAEKPEFLADRRDLCYFNIEIVDKDGNVDVHNESEVLVNVIGGELLGVYSGNPISEDVFTDNKCHVFKGRALAIVRTNKPGKVTMKVMSKDLASGYAEVTAK
jgi:beta-galactosidase